MGRSFAVGKKGYAMDLNVGVYNLVKETEGGADWQLKFGISIMFQ